MDAKVVRYGSVAQAFHWFTAILVPIAFIYGPEGSESSIDASGSDFEQQLHETLGLAVFMLTALRLLWRLVDVRPDPPGVARWRGIAAKSIQNLLYVLLCAVPLTAIVGTWLEGRPLTLLSGIEIFCMIASSPAIGETIEDIHGWLGDAIIWLAGFHALAALFHHYILKDEVLVAMLPRWFSK